MLFRSFGGNLHDRLSPDQIYIQEIINIVAPFIEEEFQDCSYGYRWNKDPESPYRIFSDWRKSYPSFRNDIISALKKYPNGYYVCCDIKEYYGHIRHILLTQLQPFIQDDYIFQIMEQYINLYYYKNDHNLGLPQGPAHARLLAKLYLNNFDKQVSEISVAYFRYVECFQFPEPDTSWITTPPPSRNDFIKWMPIDVA